MKSLEIFGMFFTVKNGIVVESSQNLGNDKCGLINNIGDFVCQQISMTIVPK